MINPRSLRIHAAALAFLGTKEVPGSGTNPVITAWINEAAEWLKDDDSQTPWCGCFRGHIGLITATGVPREHYRAASWVNWGNAVDISRPETWCKGDTVIMTRKGGNHVTLFDHLEDGLVYCLGGNQSDRVSIAPFDLGRITAMRC